MTAPLALEGLKVLDFTRVLAGPYATMLLGDLGAEIIKVEPPQGDESRSWPPMLANGQSGYFMALNRNKKSIRLNLKDKRAVDIARDLAARVDVVVENFTPGVAGKLGIDYVDLKEVNPGLIYCSISGFGQSGPYRNKKAYDPIIQGMTGLMSITGERGRSPVKIGIPITDLVAANKAVVAILAATIHRMKSGSGQYIDVALYDGMISMLTIMAMDYFATGLPPERWGLDHIHRVPARAFKTADGKYVQVAATSETMYPVFCRLLGAEELATDPRFDNNTKRVENRDQLMPLLEKKMRRKALNEWLEVFEKAGIPCGPILDLREVFSDPNIAARELLLPVEHPVEGTVHLLGFPYRLSETPPRARLHPPLLGEQTADILMQQLGFSQTRIDQLQAENVL
jgi:crotonobetainyl-CoA:carnitine CoA-transferase CaiB-like acyl-CoA transferase